MTILEALKSTASYPVPDNTVNMILIKRGLSGTDTLDATVANGKAFELSYADVLLWLSSSANISEGGFSISLSEKANLTKIASGIYSKWGESMPGDVTIINASNRW